MTYTSITWTILGVEFSRRVFDTRKIRNELPREVHMFEEMMGPDIQGFQRQLPHLTQCNLLFTPERKTALATFSLESNQCPIVTSILISGADAVEDLKTLTDSQELVANISSRCGLKPIAGLESVVERPVMINIVWGLDLVVKWREKKQPIAKSDILVLGTMARMEMALAGAFFPRVLGEI